jgi:hypothetical protein
MRARVLVQGILLAVGFPHRQAEAAGPPEDADAALPCRPTISCTAEFASPGTLEVEVGYVYRRGGPGVTERNTPFMLKLTAARWIQVELGSNGYTAAEGPPARYFDNVYAGLKFHVLDQGKIAPALAVSGLVSIPTPPQEGYWRAYDATFTAHASKDLGRIHADLNGGANLWRVQSHPLPQGLVALALSTEIVAPFSAMVESYFFSNAPPMNEDGGVLLAIGLSPKKWLVFDVGVDVGFFQATRAYSTFVGMTVVPAVLWR